MKLATASGSDAQWLKELESVADSIRDEEARAASKMLTALGAERARIDVRKLPGSDRLTFEALFWRIDHLLEARTP